NGLVWSNVDAYMVQNAKGRSPPLRNRGDKKRIDGTNNSVMATDISVRYNRKMAAMESKLASSRQRCGELQRELDQERIHIAMERQDADTALKKAREETRGEEETLHRRLREAELETKRYAEQASVIPKLKAQIIEMGAKMKEGTNLVASLKEQHEETVSNLQARID
ncbi:hypothetical protein FOZ62_016513, partial [Perkinsus olseni]